MTYKPSPLQKIRNVEIGTGAFICDFVVLNDCKIGAHTKIGPFIEIERDARIGDCCKISSHTFICQNVTIEDEVFVGHGVVFVNEPHPDKPALLNSLHQSVGIRVKKGASIGSGVVITSPAMIGEKALIGAGAVITGNVPDGATVVGNPFRHLA